MAHLPAARSSSCRQAAGASNAASSGTSTGRLSCDDPQLVLREELQNRLEHQGWSLGWVDIIRDLDRSQEVEMSIEGKNYVVRTETKGSVGKVFQACGVALPPTLRSGEAP